MVDFSNDNWQQEFDEKQLEQILRVGENDLSPEQTAVYANAKFDSAQMYEIQTDFEDDLTMEQPQYRMEINYLTDSQVPNTVVKTVNSDTKGAVNHPMT